MDGDVTTNLTKCCLVEVEEPSEKFPRTNPWIESGLTEKFKGELGLWKKKVPKARWKGRVDASKNCQEVILECANSAFSQVSAMHVRWDSWNFAFHLKVIASLYSMLALLPRI
jgi:hypothetical protein